MSLEVADVLQHDFIFILECQYTMLIWNMFYDDKCLLGCSWVNTLMSFNSFELRDFFPIYKILSVFLY